MNITSLIGLGLLGIGTAAAILCAGVLLLDLCAWAVGRAVCAGSASKRRGMFGGITPRQAVTLLTLSGAGLVGIVANEGYTDRAVIPTKGDVPTVGFGSTTHVDGSAVRMGDTTTPVKALQRSLAYLQDAEVDMKSTLVGVALHQAEYDLYMDWRYQYGPARWRSSSMLRELRAGNYVGACNALLLYKYSAGHDCSTPGNKVCPGVWTRQLARHKQCMQAQR